MAPPTRLLLTGPPGCGKTTVILKTLDLLTRPAAGFYTSEVRRSPGGRVGFDLVTIDGARGPLARKGGPGPKVGSYGVDVAAFERIGVSALERGLGDPYAVLVVDELGKMEFHSRRFVALLDTIIDAPNPLLGTVLMRPHPVADRFRAAPGVQVVTVTPRNRDALARELAATLEASE